MKNLSLRHILVLLALLVPAGHASALPKVSASLGQGVVFDDGAHATGVQGELVGSWSFMIVQADLGYIFQFNKGNASILTPGVRLNLLSFFARAGLPLRLDDEMAWGVRLGAGYKIITLGIAAIFAEVDAMFWEQVEFTKAVPITGRLGVEFGF